MIITPAEQLHQRLQNILRSAVHALEAEELGNLSCAFDSYHQVSLRPCKEEKLLLWMQHFKNMFEKFIGMSLSLCPFPAGMRQTLQTSAVCAADANLVIS